MTYMMRMSHLSIFDETKGGPAPSVLDKRKTLGSRGSGSLGSWVDEDRGKTRDSLRIAGYK